MGTDAPRTDVLIVDDDEDLRTMLEMVLEGDGYAVATAGTASRALEYLHHSWAPPRMMMLDLSLPDLDGATFRARQREIPTVAEVPLVVLSGSADIQQQATALGAADYLGKPFDIEALLKLVQHYCRNPA